VRSHTAYNAAAFTVTGSMPEFAEIRSLGVGEGRFYDQDDMREARRVAFLGSDAPANAFFGSFFLKRCLSLGSVVAWDFS
jgi:hypothetical protein